MQIITIIIYYYYPMKLFAFGSFFRFIPGLVDFLFPYLHFRKTQYFIIRRHLFAAVVDFLPALFRKQAVPTI